LSSFCRPHWIHIPPISRSAYVRPCRFSPKVFHPKRQSDSLRILISLRISDNMAYSLISLSITLCIPSLVSQGAYYLWLLLRTWKRINMVRNPVHQVKFKLEQTGWGPPKKNGVGPGPSGPYGPRQDLPGKISQPRCPRPILTYIYIYIYMYSYIVSHINPPYIDSYTNPHIFLI
jgi:hypothetical protein